MGIHSNKILSAIALVLVLTVTVSITWVPTVKAEDVEPSAAVFEAFPNPVAVGDTSYIVFDISPDPPSGYHYEWITVTLVNPDESIITLGPFMANSSGGLAMSVVFPDTGTYSAKLNYPGQMMGEDWYLPFLAGPIYIEVVEYLPPPTDSVHNLDTGLNYSAIQDAMDTPETLDGHTIFVDSGIYYENVVVNKSISLVGENSSNTIIDGGGGNSPVVNVTNVDNVEISGFTIRNGQWGVYLSGCSCVNVSDNSLTANNESGVYLGSSHSNIVSGNSISNNGDGVRLYSSPDNIVSGNNITANEYAVVVTFASFNSTVSNNSISNNTYDGVHVHFSENSTVSGNSISNSGVGVHLWSSFNSTVSSNNITANNGDGVYLNSYSRNCTVFGNNITANNCGVHLAFSSNCIVSVNSITDNEWYGAYLEYSDDIRFYHNNFIGNPTHVINLNSTFANTWDNGTEGNYWSDYNGTDSDGDGIGDTPYVIDENNQDNYPLMVQVDIFVIPENSSWAPILCILALAGAITIHKRRASKN
jgi:parallel beta-helix repeat protein